MDFSKVGEKILSSVRSARSLGFLPAASDRPEVPARAEAAAAVARALATLPPDQRLSLPSSSAELSSMYGSRSHDPVAEELEEEFYEEDFDPVMFVLEHIPSEDDELEHYETKATVRLAQLEKISAHLSRHVMEHHEEMVRGMQLVRELEKDLKIATVICMNGRRHLTSSMHEVSRDLVVTESSRKKQVLLDVLPVLTEILHALDMQKELETLVEEGNFCKLLDSLTELSAIQEMSRSVEVVDAYALIGDVSGLAEKIQSFFMQEVLSETHSVLKTTVQEADVLLSCYNEFPDRERGKPSANSDVLMSIFVVRSNLMSFVRVITNFNSLAAFVMVQDNSNEQFDNSQKPVEVQSMSLGSGAYEYRVDNGSSVAAAEMLERSSTGEYASSSTDASGTNGSLPENSNDLSNLPLDDDAVSNSGSPWYELRRDATALVSQSLQRGCKNFWQLMTSRVSVLLSSAAFCSTSIHQFLKNYEDLNVYVLAGESFCGAEASEFRKKLKAACENYFSNFHKQNIYALKMVLEKESWQKLPRDAIQVVSFAGLVGDGAPLISSLDFGSMNAGLHQSNKLVPSGEFGSRKSGFSHWIKTGNPFLTKVSSPTNCHTSSPFVDGTSGSVEPDNSATGSDTTEKVTHVEININHSNGRASILDDENEDLLADFIDEDSQLPSRISKPHLPRNHSSQWRDDEAAAQTGSSLCLLSCANGRGDAETLNHRLKTAVNRITQDCEQWLKPNLHYSSISMPVSLNSSSKNMDLTPTVPPGTNFGQSPGLKETCAAVDTVSLVASILRRSKAHLQSMLLQNNPTVVEDFFVFLVDSVPDLTEHIYRSTARLLLHINGYVERIANAKWEVKELGMEHNGYVDLLLGEFKHYRTRLAHAGIHKEVQELLLEYGVEIVAETLVEGLSRVKRCTDEGRALMSLDLQVLINGLQHFVSKDVKPKMHIVETFIKCASHHAGGLARHRHLVAHPEH
uniref:Vacuolar protein sorting-associated protein 54 N-terminal domain-containing protein n=1 Tax=Chenopodium quinoa TaxID=63459 RepID=A0A803N6G7_CHEQI